MKSRNTYELQIRSGRKIVAHASCIFANCDIQIRDLYVLKKYRGNGLGELLLSGVLDYAAEQKAQRIIAYCGAEPFCEGGQLPMEQEVAWYEDHGFIVDHLVMGATPCVVRQLVREAAV